MKRIILSLALCLAATLSFAQPALAPQSYMNYQGKLVQDSGQPLATGAYTLEINIYNSATSGTLIWGPFIFDGNIGINGHAAKVNVMDGGRFNVIMGEKDTSGRFLVDAIILSQPKQRFIDLKVGNSPSMTPRQQFLSAPYAFQSYQATRLPNVMNLANGNVGVGTDTPTERLDVNGGAYIRGDLRVVNNATVSGNSTVSGNATVVGDATIYGTINTNHVNVNSLTVNGQVSAGDIYGNIGNFNALNVNGDVRFTGRVINFEIAQAPVMSYSGSGGSNQQVPYDPAAWFCALNTVKFNGGGGYCELTRVAGSYNMYLANFGAATTTCQATCFRFK